MVYAPVNNGGEMDIGNITKNVIDYRIAAFGLSVIDYTSTLGSSAPRKGLI